MGFAFGILARESAIASLHEAIYRVWLPDVADCYACNDE